MATPQPRDRLLTIDEYLALEDASPVKHEYVAGEVHAMTGVTRRHNLIVGNIATRLWAARRGGPCRVSIAEVKLRLRDAVYYPDVMVACGPEPLDPRIEDAPCLVVEVLSESTARTDRREKLLAYQGVPSVGTYLIVAQDERRVDHYWRGDDGTWRHAAVVDDGVAIALGCPAVALTLAEVYEDVTLPPADARRVREDEPAYR